jgi:hypothetical protein
MTKLTVPVVLIIFKRPEMTQQVFEVIRQVQPPQLLVIADGPRDRYPEEARQCQATRAILEQVDWDCQIFKNFSEQNLGGKQRISSGLDWVFSLVESAIILEDDCLPSPSFFFYCQELLAYYRDDQRVMTISGNAYHLPLERSGYSYRFSRYNMSWGWATWRRAWQHYDGQIRLWPEIQQQRWLGDILDNPKAERYWRDRFQEVFENKIGGWDYRWTFACWIRSGLSIHPLVNLVSNIGFNGDATHTTIKNHLADLPLETIELPLKHPPFVLRDAQYDKLLQTHVYQMKWRDRWTYRVRAEGVWRTLAYLWGKFLPFKELSMQK